MFCIFILIFKILLLHLFICLFIGAYRHTSATVRVWSSENNLRGSLFPFQDVGPRMNSDHQELSHFASPYLVIQYKVSHWASWKPQGSTCLHFPSAGINSKYVSPHPAFCMHVLVVKLLSSCLQDEHFSN